MSTWLDPTALLDTQCMAATAKTTAEAAAVLDIAAAISGLPALARFYTTSGRLCPALTRLTVFYLSDGTPVTLPKMS